MQQFAQQLALWAQEFITGGRSPFRRVETFAPLLTETGEITPPLVFWINRDSHMAGGAIFFPPKDQTSSLPDGQLAADALGLSYYVAWGAKSIALWQCCEGQWNQTKTLPIGRGEHPGPVDFHEALMALMEEMKTCSVLGAISPDRLSPYYLANLVRATMLSLLPPLTEHFRIHRGLANNDQVGPSAERQALGKAMLTLTRIMALALHDCLPKAVQPQKLEDAIGAALATLPEPLPQTLRMAPDEAMLSDDALVKLHLLVHRLTQLGIARNPRGAIQSLEILQRQKAFELGAYPIPSPVKPCAGVVLLLHPDNVLAEDVPQMVVVSPPMLALQSLLRHAHKLAPPLASTADPMALLPEPAPDCICGTLMDNRLPSAVERKTLAAQLRLSWPARRFRLPPRTPLWAWHLLHLLGLASDEAHFHLIVPSRWLGSVYGRQILGLLLENTTLTRLRESDRGLCLEFCKSQQPDTRIRVEQDTGIRPMTNARLHQEHASLLSLALTLPDKVWNMVEDGRLTIPTSGTWPEQLEQGIFFFSRCSLGRYLWHVTGGGRPLPRRAALRTEVLRQGLPLPSTKTLACLQELQTETTTEISGAILDQELAVWLDTDPELPTLIKSDQSDPGDDLNPDYSEQDLLEAVAELVFMDGIPVFPDHYLYDYYRPEMRTYDFDAPLTISGEFFGTIELQNAEGATLQVEGMETAQALELISSLRSGPVELPVDHAIIAAILDRYRLDLKKLRSSLVKEVFRRQADPQRAKAMVRKLWQQQTLPSWHLISGS